MKLEILWWNLKQVFMLLMVMAGLYVVIAFTRYRFVHPTFTETELMLHYGDAVKLR